MKISVVTATYNSAATIRDTMESVLQQTHQDFEHIIVDGASTDETLSIVESFAPRYEGRLRVISEPDSGIYDAMNKGVALATGDVVGLLNSDDFYTSHNVLSAVANAMTDTTCDAVYGDIHYVNEEDLSKPVRHYSSKIFRPWLMRLGFMPAHPSFYCRRKCYEALPSTPNGRYFDTSFRVAADFDILLRLIFIQRIRARYLPIDFVTMRTGGASSSGLNSHRQIMNDHKRTLRQNGVWSCTPLLGLRYLYKLTEFIKLHK